MIIILFKSLGKRTSIGSYYDEKSLTKCYCPRPQLAPQPNQLLPDIHDMLHYQADYSNANPAGCSK